MQHWSNESKYADSLQLVVTRITCLCYSKYMPAILRNLRSKIKNKKFFSFKNNSLRSNVLHSDGFTLIELLVVMAIIGTLATLFVANFNAARQRARDARRKSDIHNIETALRLYKNDIGAYPASNASFQIVGCGGSACAWNAEWTNSNVTYMKELPGDPLPNRSYRYTFINSDNYSLQSCFENASDDQCTSPAAGWCSSGCIYTVGP